MDTIILSLPFTDEALRQSPIFWEVAELGFDLNVFSFLNQYAMVSMIQQWRPRYCRYAPGDIRESLGTGFWRRKQKRRPERGWKALENSVVGRILRQSPRFLSPGGPDQNNPPTVSESRTCEYDGVLFPRSSYVLWQRKGILQMELRSLVFSHCPIGVGPQILMPLSRSTHSVPSLDFCFHSRNPVP